MSDQDDKLAQFAAITGDTQHANFFLEANQWDLNAATESYLASRETGGLDQGEEVPTASSSSQQPSIGPHQATGPIQAPSEPTAPSSSRSKPPQQKKKFGSLRDLQNADRDASDDDDEKEQEYFAGGDKSGLAVQDPSGGDGPSSARDHIQRLLDTARQNRPRLPGANDEDEDTSQANNFQGSGQTLGGEGTESRVIPDPNAPPPGTAPPPRQEMVERTLHLWDDGFSVDDGPLFRYDDPANARTLEMINRGSAPLDLMNVESGQAVDVKLDQHRGEKYVRPQKKYRPFEGSGNRLGSPTPGPSTSTSSSTLPTSAPSSAPQQTGPAPEVDTSQPTVRLVIRTAEGTRLPAQFNTTATVGDVRRFIEAAHAGSASRAYVLATTFPTKELTDTNAVIGDMPELKKGGNIVQKWA